MKTPDTPTNWEADLGITPADIRKTVNVAKLRAAILKEKSLSERQGAEEERQFILNVLDGIDIADEQMGVIGGTKAIRFALQSRALPSTQEVEGEK